MLLRKLVCQLIRIIALLYQDIVIVAITKLNCQSQDFFPDFLLARMGCWVWLGGERLAYLFKESLWLLHIAHSTWRPQNIRWICRCLTWGLDQAIAWVVFAPSIIDRDHIWIAGILLLANCCAPLWPSWVITNAPLHSFLVVIGCHLAWIS